MKKGLFLAFKPRKASVTASIGRSIPDSRLWRRLPENVWSLFFIALASMIFIASARSGLAQRASSIQEPARNQIARNFDKLPLSFETNRGQADGSVKFLARTQRYSLLLTENEAILGIASWNGGSQEKTRLKNGASNSSDLPSVTMRLAGSSRNVQIAGESQLPGKANYLIGTDPAQWHTDVPTFVDVRYSGVYAGVDLVYYGGQRQVEYDFVVSPGADPAHIRLRFKGMNGMKLDKGGNLILSLRQGEIDLHRPEIYQESATGRTKVSGSFKRVARNTVGFSLGQYDHSRELIIDPVLTYSTYLDTGGAYPASAIAVDSEGSAYVAGTTYGQDGIFALKLNSEGSALVYSTVLGPGFGYAIAVDGDGNAFVAGQSVGLSPVSSGAFQATDHAGGCCNGYIAKINAAGNGILYGSYLGGSAEGAEDAIYSLAIDSSGNAYVAGTGTSVDFPTTPDAYLTTDLTPGAPFSFVAKINATGTALTYSTLLMGPGDFSPYAGPTGQANGVAIDASGNAFVVGETGDMNFPVTSGAFQTAYTTNTTDPGIFRFTGYVAKFNPTGTQVIYSSYLGGGFMASAQAVAADSAGDAYVTGWSIGSILTTPGAFQPFSTVDDAFVAKINPSGSALVYSTNLGGSCPSGAFIYGDAGRGIAVDAAGNAYVAGAACSKDFPLTTNAVDTTQKSIYYSAFLSVLNSSGTSLLYSTYLGGSDQDWANGIALDSSNNPYVAGVAGSTDFPTTAGAYLTTGSGGFISKFAVPQGSQLINRNFTMAASPASATIKRGQTATTTVTVTPINGFSQLITISCSGLPSWAYCSNISNMLIDPTSSALTTTVAVSTVPATSGVLPLPYSLAPITSVAACLFFIGLRRKWRSNRWWVLVGFALSASMLSGCGSGSGGGSQANTFTVTITAAAETMVQTTTFTVTAN